MTNLSSHSDQVSTPPQRNTSSQSSLTSRLLKGHPANSGIVMVSHLKRLTTKYKYNRSDRYDPRHLTPQVWPRKWIGNIRTIH